MLISVALFGHQLDFVQWVGVVDVFAGLGVQMAFGGGGHGAPLAAAAAAPLLAHSDAAGSRPAASTNLGATAPASKKAAGGGGGGSGGGGRAGSGGGNGAGNNGELYSVSPLRADSGGGSPFVVSSDGAPATNGTASGSAAAELRRRKQ